MFETRRRVFLRYVAVFLLLMVFLYTVNRILLAKSDEDIEVNENKIDLILQTPRPKLEFANTGSTENPEIPKRVLLWNWRGLNTTVDLTSWSLEGYTLSDCPFKCEFTTNNSDLYMVHSVIFDTNVLDTDYTIPSSRENLDQLWTLFRTESPISLSVNCDLYYFYNNINWTMTYRRDSDIPWPAGQLLPRNLIQNEPSPTIESLKSKSLVAWLDSDCKTSNHRGLYVRNLTKFIPVDNYGVCKPQKAPCSPNTTNCHQKLATQYKFWLVYETAFCVDYLTEEYYKALEYGMVPIIFAHERALEIALKGTYINGRDFKTPEDLAKYIRHLDENPEEYLKYFEWRKQFQVVEEQELVKKTWCNFCTKLHQVDLKRDWKFYKNMNDWFMKNFTDQRRQCEITIFTESSNLFFSMFKFH